MKSRIRLSDLPSMGFLGSFLRWLKMIEVILFKFLDFVEIYRPLKSIVGIPSLATRGSTSLQAVVYNGSQNDVLRFRHRRLLHRIVKGVPDTEYFERIRFFLNVSDNAVRTVEGSTEHRGFVHLQLPWQMPFKMPETAWLRMASAGVETPLGRIHLGEYEIVSCPIFFLHEGIRNIIVSDIDDTIKDSHIHESTSWREIFRAVFRGNYYRYEAITGMADLYRRMAAGGTLIIYLTSTPYQLVPFLLKFLRDAGFPEGPVFPRWLGYGKFGHKWRTLHRLLTQVEAQRVFLVGDSGEQDLQIYRRVMATPSFAPKVSRIFIRQVPGTALPKVLSSREVIYQHSGELDAGISGLLVN